SFGMTRSTRLLAVLFLVTSGTQPMGAVFSVGVAVWNPSWFVRRLTVVLRIFARIFSFLFYPLIRRIPRLITLGTHPSSEVCPFRMSALWRSYPFSACRCHTWNSTRVLNDHVHEGATPFWSAPGADQVSSPVLARLSW